MKDRVAREAIDGIRQEFRECTDRSAKMREDIKFLREYLNAQSSDADKLYGRVGALETELAALKETLRPTCKSCGQKIQEGFQPGDVEKVAAEVRRKK